MLCLLCLWCLAMWFVLFPFFVDRLRSASLMFTFLPVEENGTIPFLDSFVSHDNNKLRTTVYRPDEHNLFATRPTLYVAKTTTYNACFTKIITNLTKQNRHPRTVTAIIPCITGASDIISRMLRPYNIRVDQKPITTLRHILTNVRDKEQP